MSNIIVVFDFQFEFEIELITKYSNFIHSSIGPGNYFLYFT